MVFSTTFFSFQSFVALLACLLANTNSFYFHWVGLSPAFFSLMGRFCFPALAPCAISVPKESVWPPRAIQSYRGMGPRRPFFQIDVVP